MRSARSAAILVPRQDAKSPPRAENGRKSTVALSEPVGQGIASLAVVTLTNVSVW